MDEQIVKKLLELSRLSLTENEKNQLLTDLTAIIKYVEIMQAIPTDGIEPLSHPVDLTQPLRDDEPEFNIERDKYQAIAPKTADGLYLVPNVITKV